MRVRAFACFAVLLFCHRIAAAQAGRSRPLLSGALCSAVCSTSAIRRPPTASSAPWRPSTRARRRSWTAWTSAPRNGQRQLLVSSVGADNADRSVFCRRRRKEFGVEPSTDKSVRRAAAACADRPYWLGVVMLLVCLQRIPWRGLVPRDAAAAEEELAGREPGRSARQPPYGIAHGAATVFCRCSLRCPLPACLCRVSGFSLSLPSGSRHGLAAPAHAAQLLAAR